MKHNIVILGAGFGGIQAAITLSKQLKKLKNRHEYEIIIIDRNPYHVFPPLLYEIATTSEQSANTPVLQSLVTYSLHELLLPWGVTTLAEEILHVDFDARMVHLSREKKLPFAYLVIALGSESNFFDIPGLEKEAMPMKTFTDAIAIRNRIATLVKSKKTTVDIVIGGGGATGVELAGEIKEWIPELEDECRSHCGVNVTIIEASPNILAPFDPRVRTLAETRLKELSVHIKLNTRITSVTPDTIATATDEQIPFDILIWTGGVKPAPLVTKMPLAKEPRGRITVSGGLVCTAQSSNLEIEHMVYAIGDIACFLDPKTKLPLPLMARPAMIEGRIAAQNIIENIKKSGVTHTYEPYQYPYIIPVGGKYAVAKIGSWVISGIFAWIFKGIVELNYFISIMPIPAATRVWFRGFRIFIRNDRLG